MGWVLTSGRCASQSKTPRKKETVALKKLLNYVPGLPSSSRKESASRRFPLRCRTASSHWESSGWGRRRCQGHAAISDLLPKPRHMKRREALVLVLGRAQILGRRDKQNRHNAVPEPVRRQGTGPLGFRKGL